jgi:hypothetical protein
MARLESAEAPLRVGGSNPGCTIATQTFLHMDYFAFARNDAKPEQFNRSKNEHDRSNSPWTAFSKA